MRWNIRRITSRNPSCSIDQKIRKGCRQNSRLLLGIVKVPSKRNGIFLNILQKIASHLRQACLSITHRCWWITVHGTIVPVHLNENLTVFPVLRHADHGIVDGAVTVGVEIPHDVPDRLGRLTVAFVKGVAVLVHGIKNTALNRLQTIANVRQGPLLNDVFGVATKALSHDVLKGHVLNVGHNNSLYIFFNNN